jgi:hypothetical protein
MLPHHNFTTRIHPSKHVLSFHFCPGELVLRGSRNSKRGLGTLSTNEIVPTKADNCDANQISVCNVAGIHDDCKEPGGLWLRS